MSLIPFGKLIMEPTDRVPDQEMKSKIFLLLSFQHLDTALPEVNTGLSDMLTDAILCYA